MKIRKEEVLTYDDIKDLKFRAAVYCRVSTVLESQQTSVKHQMNGLESLIHSNPNWEYEGTYIDIGTGTNIKRQKNLLLLKKKCLRGEINLIVFKSTTRFSRDTLDALSFIREVLPEGVFLYFDIDGFAACQKYSNECYMGLTIAFAKEEVRNMSNSIAWGYERQYEKGIQPRKTKCLGYDYDLTGSLVINSKEAEVVKLIFDEYLKGNTVYGIVKILNDKGIKTVKGNDKWNKNTIQGILQNEIYTGQLLMPKTMRNNVSDLTWKPVNHHKKQYLVEDNHPAIITTEQFQSVKNEMEKRSKKSSSAESLIPRKHSSRNPLSNILVCKECGSSFRRVLRKRKGVRVPCWVCATHAEALNKKCQNGNVYKESELLERIGTINQNNDLERRIIKI